MESVRGLADGGIWRSGGGRGCKGKSQQGARMYSFWAVVRAGLLEKVEMVPPHVFRAGGGWRTAGRGDAVAAGGGRVPSKLETQTHMFVVVVDAGL